MNLATEMTGLAPLTPAACDAFERALPRILATVNDGLALGASPTGADVDLPFLTDAQGHFGRTMAAAGRYGLWKELSLDLAGFVRCLLNRGGGSEVLDRMLKAWIIALHSAVKHPEVTELKTPFELLLRSRNELLDMARRADPPAPANEAFLQAILAGKADEALALLFPVRSVLSEVDHIIAATLYPALNRTGVMWCENLISVAEEHRATATLRSVIARFFDELPAAQRIPALVAVTCVPGDEHDVGAEIVSRYLEHRGWSVSFIGHSSPGADILRTLEAERPFAVLLSVSMIAHLLSLENLTSAIRSRLPDTRLLAGGRGVASAREVASRMVDAVADSPAETHALLNGYLR